MSIVAVIIILALILILVTYFTEGFRGGRGRRGRRGWHGGGHWRGGGGRWRGGGFNPHRYLRRFRRRSYGYPYWNNVTIWPSSWYDYPAPCNCKRGCTPDGCAFPGYGPNDCVWASDCNCC